VAEVLINGFLADAVYCENYDRKVSVGLYGRSTEGRTVWDCSWRDDQKADCESPAVVKTTAWI
jgi:hypothetical protein